MHACTSELKGQIKYDFVQLHYEMSETLCKIRLRSLIRWGNKATHPFYRSGN